MREVIFFWTRKQEIRKNFIFRMKIKRSFYKGKWVIIFQ